MDELLNIKVFKIFFDCLALSMGKMERGKVIGRYSEN
jgi:hypothetical protein